MRRLLYYGKMVEKRPEDYPTLAAYINSTVSTRFIVVIILIIYLTDVG